MKPFIGPVATVDVFYNPDEDYVTKWRGRGILGFEMEASALFYLASRAQGSGRTCARRCALTVSDTLSEEETSEGTYLSLADLEAATDRMIEIALEAGTARMSGCADPGRGQPDHDRGQRRLVDRARRGAWRRPASPPPGPGTTSSAEGRRTDPMLECWTLMTAVAMSTGRLKVGSFVLNVMNRHPAVLARMAATLADLAPGRVELGIGIGGDPRAQLAYGIEWPEVPERVARLEEAVTVLRLLFSGGPVSFEGRFHTLTDAVAFPVPTPAPRITIGGESPAGARLGARIGDAWTCSGADFDARYPVFLEALAAAGRRREDVQVLVGLDVDRTDPARGSAGGGHGRQRRRLGGARRGRARAPLGPPAGDRRGHRRGRARRGCAPAEMATGHLTGRSWPQVQMTDIRSRS